MKGFIPDDKLDYVSRIAPFLRPEVAWTASNVLHSKSDHETWKKIGQDRRHVYEVAGNTTKEDILSTIDDSIGSTIESIQKNATDLYLKPEFKEPGTRVLPELYEKITGKHYTGYDTTTTKSAYLNFVDLFTQQVTTLTESEDKTFYYSTLYNKLITYKGYKKPGELIDYLNSCEGIFSQIIKSLKQGDKKRFKMWVEILKSGMFCGGEIAEIPTSVQQNFQNSLKQVAIEENPSTEALTQLAAKGHIIEVLSSNLTYSLRGFLQAIKKDGKNWADLNFAFYREASTIWGHYDESFPAYQAPFNFEAMYNVLCAGLNNSTIELIHSDLYNRFKSDIEPIITRDLTFSAYLEKVINVYKSYQPLFKSRILSEVLPFEKISPDTIDPEQLESVRQSLLKYIDNEALFPEGLRKLSVLRNEYLTDSYLEPETETSKLRLKLKSAIDKINKGIETIGVDEYIFTAVVLEKLIGIHSAINTLSEEEKIKYTKLTKDLLKKISNYSLILKK